MPFVNTTPCTAVCCNCDDYAVTVTVHCAGLGEAKRFVRQEVAAAARLQLFVGKLRGCISSYRREREWVLLS